MQMSDPGGTQITQKGRDAWNNYMINHFRLGQPTGMSKVMKRPATVPSPADNGPGIRL